MGRDDRVRVLQALEGAVKQFRTRERIWPLRAPAQPVSLDRIVGRTLAGEARRFDPFVLRSRALLRLGWNDGSTWELWIITLGSGLKLYCDSDGEESRILASGRRDSEIDTDRLFLELLAESAGAAFGIDFEGGPPSRVQSSLKNRDEVVDFFVHLFEVAAIEEDVRAELEATPGTRDFRNDVERWLQRAMR